MKQVIVTFNFDPESELVSDIKCSVDGVEKKKTTTRTKKQSTKEEVLESEALITLEANKLVFNNKAISEMELVPENRILIIYEQENKKTRFPVIGTDLAFDQEGSGNKLTKAGSIAFRGNANTILSEWGSVFGITPYKDGTWKLVSKDVLNPPTYAEILEEVEKEDFSMYTDEKEEFEIDEVLFKF